MSNLRDMIIGAIKTRTMDALQIAEAINQPIENLNEALRDLVAANVIIKEKIPGETGSRAYVFTANPAHVSWVNKDHVPDLTKKIDATVAGPTKVEIAIAYLTQHGKATAAELRKAMDIPQNYSPSQYLGAAVKSGRVMRDGDNWILGSKHPGALLRPPKIQMPVKAPKEQQVPVKPTPAPAVDTIKQIIKGHTDAYNDAINARIEIGHLHIEHSLVGDIVITSHGQPLKLSARDATVLTQFLNMIKADRFFDIPF